MIRELRHLIDVLRGQVPVLPRRCDNRHCGREMTSASKFEAARFEQRKTVRCARCYSGAMVQVPQPGDHIARAADYYTEQGLEP